MHPSFWAAFRDELAKVGITKIAYLGQSGRVALGGGLMQSMRAVATPSATKPLGLAARIGTAVRKTAPLM